MAQTVAIHTSAANDVEPGLYPGSWLLKAKHQIGQIRMADMVIDVIDENGPLPGAAVEVDMLRHAFPFGCAVSAKRMVADSSPDGDRYRSMVTSLFNRVVLENDLKWPAWEGEWEPGHSQTSTLAAIDWLEQQGISIRGHCLVWPGWKHLPKSLEEVRHDPDRLRQQIHKHIRDIAGRFKGRLADWDVANETFWYRDLQETLGPDAMADWFREARAAAPDARLFINDARILAFGGQEPDHKDFYYDEVARLVEAEAPIDGIGFQSHFYDHALTHPEDVWAMLDRFATFELDLAVTEYDYMTDDEDRQARYMYDFMHAIFSHPRVTQFIMWSFWEGQVFRKPCALYREDWSEKPAGTVFRDLVFKEWWTRERLQTDQQGRVKIRGFLGDYRINVRVDGVERATNAVLTAAGLNMVLGMPELTKVPDKENEHE